MRAIAIAALLVAGCGGEDNTSTVDASADFGSDLGICDPSEGIYPLAYPSCCPGTCYQDACCDHDCYRFLVPGDHSCHPGLNCTYCLGQPTEGFMLTCTPDGSLICSGYCTDFAAPFDLGASD